MNETKIIPIDYLHYSTLNALRFILHLNNTILCQTKFMESSLKKIYSKFQEEESKKEESLLLNEENKDQNNFNVYEEFLKLKNSYNGKHFFFFFYRQSKK